MFGRRQRRDDYYQQQPVYRGPSVSARIWNFLALIGITFAIVLAVVVSQRLSTDAIAIVTGFVIAGVPLLALCMLLIFLLIKALQNQNNRPSPPPTTTIPQIVMTMPQALPQPQNYGWGGGSEGYGQHPQGWQPSQQTRGWETIGDESLIQGDE